MTEWVAGSVTGISVAMGLDMRNGIGIRIVLGSIQYHVSEREALVIFKPKWERSIIKRNVAGQTSQYSTRAATFTTSGGGTATSTCHTPGAAREGINHRNRSSRPHPQHSARQSPVKCRDQNSRHFQNCNAARSSLHPRHSILRWNLLFPNNLPSAIWSNFLRSPWIRSHIANQQRQYKANVARCWSMQPLDL